MTGIENPLVSAQWVNENIADPNLVILDASVKKNASNLVTDFPGMKIPRARYFDTKNVFSRVVDGIGGMMLGLEEFEEACGLMGLTAESKIVVYDNLGIYNSPRVWWMFVVMGHQDVFVLDGGINAWVDKNLGLVPLGEEVYVEQIYKSRFNPRGVVDFNQVLNNISGRGALVIDARSRGRFEGSSPEPRDGIRGGHIPNSICLPYSKVLERGRYKSKIELIKIFEELELGDEPLYFSCGSGVTACIILLAAVIVNDNPKSLYDGSWTEWGSSYKLPIEI